MKQIILYTAVTLFSINAISQKEKFDIVSFEAPKGYQRTDSNGTVLFQQAKSVNGHNSFCQMLLFPSQASSGNAETDFNNGWNERIVKYLGSTAKPVTETQKTPDGWTQTTGYTDLTQQGITFRCILVSMTGFNKSMYIVVNFGGPDFSDDVVVFFKNLDMHPEYVTGNLWNNNEKAPESNTAQGPASLSDYVFKAPAGWTAQAYADGI